MGKKATGKRRAPPTVNIDGIPVEIGDVLRLTKQVDSANGDYRLVMTEDGPRLEFVRPL